MNIKIRATFMDVQKQLLQFTGSIVLGLVIVIGAILTLTVMPAEKTHAQEAVKNAYVVVRYGDSDVDVRAITYTGTISEWTALERAGLNPAGFVHSSFGLMLCGINGVGQVNATNDGCDNGSFWWSTKDVIAGIWQDNLGVTTVFSDHGHVSGFVWGTVWPSANPPAGARMKSAAAGLNWLREQQAADGGYGDVSSSAEVLMAVAGNGCDPASWNNGTGGSLLDYVQANGSGYATKASNVGKLMVSLAAAGEDVNTFLGGSLVSTMTGYYSPTTGTYDSGTAFDEGVGPHSWAVLGMRAVSETVPVSATNYLTGNMQAEGCWEWSSGWGCDTNSTALAVQALIATGVSTDVTEVISGVTWLKSKQNDDSGFPYDSGDSDTNSTAYVIQALLAAGESLAALAKGNPIDYLISVQQSDGQFFWQSDQPGFGTSSTRQAIPPLLDTPLPIRRIAGLTNCALTEIQPSPGNSISYLPVVLKN